MKRGTTKDKVFLAAFAGCASITVAAKAAKIDRVMHYRWLREKPGYAEAFALAGEQAAQVLEDEAVRRAHEGLFVPNVYQGGFVYPSKKVKTPILTKTGKHQIVDGEPQYEETIVYGKKPLGLREYSDTLLMFLLKGKRPELYRDRRVTAEMSGPNGGPIPIEHTGLTKLTDDELAQLISLAGKLATAAPDGSGAAPPAAKQD
jgi:hypothetical protein